MAITYKVLGQVNPTSLTETILYTAANQAVCSTITICNTSVSAVVRVAVRPGGALLDVKHYICYDLTLNQYDTLTLTLGITLAATDIVSVYSSTSTVAFSMFGQEIS